MEIPVQYQNPHAKEGLKLSMSVVENTPIEDIERNIRFNSRKYRNWLQAREDDRDAVIIGGGYSINDHIADIQKLQSNSVVFALNGASNWAREHGIIPDYQVILDAKEETSTLVDEETDSLFASQCNPKTTEKGRNLILWHLIRPGAEEFIPKYDSDYALVGGDSTVGISALCIAYTMGHRNIHVFGYDTSYKDNQSHAYKQDINRGMPTMEVECDGRSFVISMAMRNQPETFMQYTQALEEAGCSFNVYGDGLLQTHYRVSIRDRKT